MKNDKKFKEEYKKLNNKQKEAVDTIEGPVMVIAGPGTGKTTILTLRIANILYSTDTPISGILALTFTESGVRAMREKLIQIIGEAGYEIPIYTFHGFAMSVIKEFEEYFPHLAKSKNITEIESEKIIRDILKEQKFKKLRPLGEPDYYINKIISTISESKREAWTPDMIEEFAKSEIENIKKDDKNISLRGKTKGELKAEAKNRILKCEKTIIFSEIYRLYEQIKKSEQKIDFDDMLFELLQSVRKNELLLRLIQEKYLYIMIDEHQDTNDTQNEVIKMLADFFDNPNIFIVGDEKQAIYRFQGASVENFLSLEKIWKDMKIIQLEENYRSHQNILDASFEMIEKNYPDDLYKNLRVKLKAKDKKTKKPIEVLISENQENEEFEIVRRIKDIEKDNQNKTIAIILRNNKDVERIFGILKEANIEARAEKGANIFRNSLGELYFELLEFIKEGVNTEALAKTILGGLWHFDFKKQLDMLTLLKSGKIDKVLTEIKDFEKIREEIYKTNPLQSLILLGEISGFTEKIQSPLEAEIWRGIINLAEEIIESEKIESTHSLIDLLLTYKKTAEKRYIKINSGNRDSKIKIMTSHGSKGLEFDFVFIPYALEEYWVKKNHGNPFVLPKEKEVTDDIKDDRRLFFVALTRAKEHVIISYHTLTKDQRKLSPVRFIEELGKNIVESKIIKQNVNIKSKISLKKNKEIRNKEKIEYAKNMILENGLSVTALNHFLECPNKFFYKSILRIPEAPSVTSEKGNAMHEAMKGIWSAIKKINPQNINLEEFISENIKKIVIEYFKNSPISKFEKEIILEELINDAGVVSHELLEHFTQNGTVLTENWYEKYLNIDLDKENIKIKIHGKLDTVIEKDNITQIYDYKTTKGKTINAIKGETMSGDGGYFRQLIFYKILLMDKNNGKLIEPSLVFIKPDEKNRCPIITVPITNDDIDRVMLEIKTLIEKIWEGNFLTEKCQDETCKYCKLQNIS